MVKTVIYIIFDKRTDSGLCVICYNFIFLNGPVKVTWYYPDFNKTLKRMLTFLH